MKYEELNNQTMEFMKQMFKEQPEKMKAFKHFMQSVEEGKLDMKTKELILVGIALKAQCTRCIALHVKKAVESGATREEILETIWLATLMGGGPTLMYGQEAIEALEEFSK